MRKRLMYLLCAGVMFSSMFVVSAAEKPDEAKEILEPTRLSLITAGTDLSSVLTDIEKQTGNKLVDFRERFNQEASPNPWNFSLSKREFWPVLDRFLDAADLDLYTSSGEEALAVVNRTRGTAPRYGRACYAGPFRIEALSVTARRGLRFPEESSAQLDLEIAWEPRLNPISFSLATDEIHIVGDDQTSLVVEQRPPVLGAEVSTGSHAVDLVVPLELPPRQVRIINSVKANLTALIPARKAEFRFTDLAAAKNAVQTQDDMKVELVAVRKNQAIWEIHMRLEFDGDVPALELQRGWAFQNLTFLENPEGEVIDHAGFETTIQTERTLGLAYFFDLPVESLEGYTWVYRTPAAIQEVPVEFELKEIPLP